MKSSIAILGIVLAAGCASRAVEPSLGDSPVHQVKCPIFVTWKMCVAKADRKFCNGNGARLLHPSAEELEESRADGSTVPVEGRIRHRAILVMCKS